MLERAVLSPSSKWTFFAGSNAEFLQRALRTKQLVGLVTQAEYNAFPRDFVRCMTSNAFLHFVCDVAPTSQPERRAR